MHMQRLALENPFSNSPIFYKPETDSTMVDAKNLARQGYPSGTIMIAGHQTDGRGRHADRQWYSPPETSLSFTVLLRDVEDYPAAVPTTLSLRAGLALALTIDEELLVPTSIKWPNDVLLKGKKVAGILAERRGKEAYLGVGVNCNIRKLPRQLRATATSLRRATGRKVEPLEVFSLLLPRLHTSLLGADFHTQIRDKLHYLDTTVELKVGNTTSRVVVKGVDSDGLLVVFPIDGKAEERHASAEILGPVPSGRKRGRRQAE